MKKSKMKIDNNSKFLFMMSGFFVLLFAMIFVSTEIGKVTYSEENSFGGAEGGGGRTSGGGAGRGFDFTCSGIDVNGYCYECTQKTSTSGSSYWKWCNVLNTGECTSDSFDNSNCQNTASTQKCSLAGTISTSFNKNTDKVDYVNAISLPAGIANYTLNVTSGPCDVVSKNANGWSIKLPASSATQDRSCTFTATNNNDTTDNCSQTINFTMNDTPTTCGQNQFLNNGVCENCPTGSTSAGGTVTKCDCPSGKIWNNSTKKCVDTSGGETGITCSSGKYLPAHGADSGDCETCLSGYYCTGGTFERSGSNQGLERCSTLDSGSYTSSSTGATKATDCYIPKANLVGKYVDTAKNAPVTCTANYYCPGSSNIYYGNTGGRVVCPNNGTSPAGSDEESDCTSITKFCHDNGYYATEAEAKNGTTINYGGTSKCSAKEGYRLVEDAVHPSTAGYTMCYIKKCTYIADTITCNASNKMYYTSTQAADAGAAACTLGLKSTPYDADTKCYTYECKKAEDPNEYSVEFKNAKTLKCTPTSENGEKPKCSVVAPTTATCSSGEFLGWSSTSSATTVSYAGGSTITVRASTTFYPVCKAGGLDSVCSYVGENLDTYIVTRKTQFLNCKYVNIMWNGQPATEDEKNACCVHKGWTFVPQGGLDYEYCIKCGTKTCDSKNNEYATEAERDAAIFNNCKYGNRKWTTSNGCYKYECEGAPSSESSIKPSSSTPSLKPSSKPPLPPDNPDTGSGLVVLVGILGMFMVGYSVWYFKKNEE